MDKKIPTIKEIAQRLNISVSTVSRALHDHKTIGLRTRARVQELAATLGYQPNLSAISLKHGKTYVIGVIVPNLREEFFSRAITGIEDLAIEKNYTVLIGQTHDDTAREEQIVDTFVRHRVDGLIISLAKHTGKYKKFEELVERNFPMVFFDRVPPGNGFHKVYSNMYDGTRQAIEYLFKKGHKRIALINGPKQMISSAQRLEMYKTAMEKRRLKIDMQLVVSTDLTRSGTFAAMEELSKLKNKPTAVLVTNDYVAMDAIHFAKEKGIVINKEILFVSYANSPITCYMEHQPIASVEQFPYKQAQRAAEILFEQLKSSDPENKKFIIEEIAPNLVENKQDA